MCKSKKFDEYFLNETGVYRFSSISGDTMDIGKVAAFHTHTVDGLEDAFSH